MNEGGGGGEVPRSLLLNRAETLATPANVSLLLFSYGVVTLHDTRLDQHQFCINCVKTPRLLNASLAWTSTMEPRSTDTRLIRTPA